MTEEEGVWVNRIYLLDPAGYEVHIDFDDVMIEKMGNNIHLYLTDSIEWLKIYYLRNYGGTDINRCEWCAVRFFVNTEGYGQDE